MPAPTSVAELIDQVDRFVRLLFRITIVAGVAYLLLLWRARPDVVRARLFLYSDHIRTIFIALAVASAILAAEAFPLLVAALPRTAELALRFSALIVLAVVVKIPIRKTANRVS